jgi:EF-hand domain pair
MFPAIAAASSAIDALKALTSTKPTTGANQDSANLFAFSADASTSAGKSSGSGGGSSSSISPETMSALLAAQSQSGSDVSSLSMRSSSLKDWFAKVDSDGDGKISKSEFEALGSNGSDTTQADDLLSKLDKDGDGSVSLDELMSALKGKGHQRHHPQQANGSGDPSQSDPLMQALDGSLDTSAANTSASSTATSTYNLMDQLVQRQSSMISAQASSSLSVSV